jgi:methylase of polypeptide subunit release factors/DNA modification methylase
MKDLAKQAYEFWLQSHNVSDLSAREKRLLRQFGLTRLKRTANTIDQDELYSSLSTSYRDSVGGVVGKKNGIVYTPQWLASHIVSNAVRQWQKVHRGGRPPQTAADVSCGTGIFLTELDKQFNQAQWNCKIFGFDKDEVALKIAELYSWATTSTYILELKDTLTLGVDLFSDPNPEEKFDIIVGNPPYVRSHNLDKDYLAVLRESYLSARKGAFDLSVVFVEKILDLLNDGGIASLIITNKFATAAYGKELCRLLARQVRVISIEDFHDNQLFQGYTTYTCILTIAKLKPAKSFLLRKHFESVDFTDPKLTGYKSETVPYDALKDHPWNLTSGLEGEIIRRCSDKVHPLLTDLFGGAYQGIRTGANEIFILGQEALNGYEKKYLKPFVTAKNIGGVTLKVVDKYLIYPYEDTDGAVSRLDESSFKKDAPNLYKYLLTHKYILSSRSLQASSAWYEFSRGQNLTAINRKKILIKEMMPVADFSIDLSGEIAFAAGYALDAENLSDDHIVAWAAILCTPVMEFMLRHHGTQLHSGWFRLMKQHLSKVRVPRMTKASLAKVSRIFDNNRTSFETKLQKINVIVSDMFGLDESHNDFIRKYLDAIHDRSTPKKISNPEREEKFDRFEPVRLTKYNRLHVDREDLRRLVTFIPNKDLPIHSWYKYTQGFSAELVNTLLDELQVESNMRVLDPFNGCGTTTTTCAYRGVPAIGLEISPLMCKVAEIKTRRWSIERLRRFRKGLKASDFQKIETDHERFVFQDYIGKAYAQQISYQLAQIGEFISTTDDGELRDVCSISLLGILEDVSLIRKHGSHYRFLNKSSSTGLQKLNISVVSEDTDIYETFLSKLNDVIHDISATGGMPQKKATIRCRDARSSGLRAESVDLVITSPPYLNRNNYIAQQKAELDFLGLIATKAEYTRLVRSTFRSHTDSNLNSKAHSEIEQVQNIVDEIRLEDGNNPKIPHMICGYFDDLDKTVAELYRILKPGGKAAVVVGNTRWGGIVVPVDHLLLMLAENCGFKAERVLVTRLKGNSPQQMRKYGRIPVRESIVVVQK